MKLQWNVYEGRKFGFDEYVNLIESYEAAGYCIEAVLLDYANKMKKGSVGTSDKRDDLAISELFCNLCNYNKVKGYYIYYCTSVQS